MKLPAHVLPATIVLALVSTAQATPKPITIFLSGDILPARGVTPNLSTHRTNLTHYQPQIQNADLAFGNLECALQNTPKPGAFKVELLTPPANLKYLQEAGFDLLPTAHNHALDNGATGQALLQKAAQTYNLATIGSSPTPVTTWPPFTRQLKGQSISWLAASNWGPFQKGTARVRPIDASLSQQTRTLAAKGDKVIVSLHWGHEYSPTATAGQKQLAHALIDAGAICVVGHHPHCTGPVETYRGRPIFYSLGNFVFDRTPLPQSGLTALLTIQDDKVTFQTTPVNPLPDSTPKLPTPPREKLRGELAGHFLKEATPQRLQWTQTPSGAHVLRLFKLELNQWQQVAQGTHPIIEAMKIADLDGDGIDDIWLQLRQRSKLDVNVRSRLHLYRADARRGFLPLWRGSTLSRPFQEWSPLPRTGKGTDLVALESNPTIPDFNWVAVYRWNGFGFRRLWNSPLRGHLKKLIVSRDNQGPFLHFTQHFKTKARKLELRPNPENSAQLFRAFVIKNWQ